MSTNNSWNRPNNTPQVIKPRDGVSWKRGAIAAALIVCGAIGAWFFLRSAGEKPVDESVSTNRLIKAVTPAKAPVAEKPKKKWPKWMNVPDDWDKPYPPQAYWPDGRLKQYSRYVKVVTNDTAASQSVVERTFKNVAEQEIATLLVSEPGGLLVGEGPKYDKSFVKIFLRSLETPITIDEENDTPFQQDLKRAMIETKKDLKARYDAGEDIAKIMQDAYDEQKELSLYRQELEEQVDKIRIENKGQFTDKDVKDLIDAANKMLAERGCKELAATEIFEHRMQLKAARKAAKEGVKE